MKRARQFTEISISAMEKQSTLAKSRLCIGMTPAEVQELAPFVQSYHLDAGTDIYEEGDTEAFLCLIVQGVVNIYKNLGEPGEKTLAILGVGETVGEMAVIDEMPRSASARAAVESTLFAFTRRNLLEFYKSSPRTWAKLIYNIAMLLCQRLRDTNKILASTSYNIAPPAAPTSSPSHQMDFIDEVK